MREGRAGSPPRSSRSTPTDLPWRPRAGTLVLRFVNELSAREIGALMGRSEGAVRVLIHRALAAVRERLAT